MSNPTVTEQNESKDGELYHVRLNDISQKFIADILEEKERLGENFPLCAMLIDDALERVYSTGRVPGREFYADVFKQKPLKVTQKVFVPVKQFPKFNFTGKILGPKGNCLRRLQDETQCKIVIKGRNSTRDNAKEEELRTSGDPKYAHFNKDLYVEISTVATPAESYARIAYALAEIRKYIIPDKNDEVSHEQFREMLEISPDASKPTKTNVYKSVLDKKIVGSNGAPKFLNLIKKTAYQPPEQEYQYQQEYEEEEVAYEYPPPKQYIVKRPATYEYNRVHPSHVTPYKRPQSSMYSTDIKRFRETSTPQYKPSPYDVFKKYRS